MIRKLQHRFILITMSGIILIFILILAVLNLSVSYSAQRQGYHTLSQYERRMDFSPSPVSDAQNPPPVPEGHPMEMSWFDDMRVMYVFYDNNGEILSYSLGGNPDMTMDTLEQLAARAKSDHKQNGKVSGYLYLLKEKEDGTQLYLLDYSPERDMSARLLKVCLWVGLAAIFVLFIPVIFLSRWVTKPVQVAFDKQKQFIADASHELKTPLTIITTNAEVLQRELPDNKWLVYILEQTGRMKNLINSLLELARLDAYSDTGSYLTFDLSRAVKNAALSFESLAFEYGKSYSMEIEDGFSLHGNETHIKQLVTILLDNAFKYSDEHGTVRICLSAHGDKKMLLVSNTGKGISPEDQKHIFERFYRSDSSRNRQYGGYGLGLSIAQSIVKAHKGHISVKSDGQSFTEFVVILP